ncbi:MAG TPA: hypothetical protein VNO35_29855 [Steroidobacteraceae bacterium]|nr:hypothetical protein [Steroidobacteraceae bacterium]
MTRQLGIALTILALGCVTAAAGFDAADQTTLAKHVLTEDELNRLMAVMEDAKGHGHAPSVNMAGAGSLDALAAKVDTEPGIHALLAAHGFTAQDYVVAALTTARTAMMAQMGAGNPNVAFYRAHQAQIDRMMDLGPGAASAAGNDEDLSALNTKKLGECTKVAMGPVALMPLSMRGTAGGPPESREHIANALANLVTKVGEQNLKDDFRDISDEIRRQAAAPQFTSTPRFTRAVDDVKNWLQGNCSKEALKQ